MIFIDERKTDNNDNVCDTSDYYVKYNHDNNSDN